MKITSMNRINSTSRRKSRNWPYLCSSVFICGDNFFSRPAPLGGGRLGIRRCAGVAIQRAEAGLRSGGYALLTTRNSQPATYSVSSLLSPCYSLQLWIQFAKRFIRQHK